VPNGKLKMKTSKKFHHRDTENTECFLREDKESYPFLQWMSLAVFSVLSVSLWFNFFFALNGKVFD